MAATVLIEMHGPYEFPDAPTVTFWSARLLRSEDGVTECIGTAQGVHVQGALSRDQVDALDEISEEYGSMACDVLNSPLMKDYGCDVLFISDVCVAPAWRGHNLGPNLLRWMAAELGGLMYIFLVPVPLPTRLGDDGTWVTDWWMPRAGSGARKKVRRAYRRGGFTRLASHTWFTEMHGDVAEMKRVRRVMKVVGKIAA